MRQHKDHISRKKALNGVLNSCFLMGLLSCCLSTEKAFGDNTFIINFVVSDGKVSGGPATDNAAAENSKIIEKTIVLPSQKGEATEVTVAQPQSLIPPKVEASESASALNVEAKPIPLTQPQAIIPAKAEAPESAPILNAQAKPVSPTQPQALIPAKAEASESAPVLNVETKPVPLTQPQAIITANKEASKEILPSKIAVKTDSKILPPVEDQKSVQLTPVEARPKALPVHETTQAAASLPKAQVPQKTLVSYEEATKGHSPLGVLTPDQAVHSQRWYLYSATTRSLRDFPDGVRIVSVEGKTPNRGESVKKLLVEMGVEPTKIKLIPVAGEAKQAGYTYIFAEE
jgi:hypothetical protein